MRRATTWALALAVSAGFVGALLLASHVGQQLRCQRLTAAHSPSTTTYDCTGTGPR